MTKSPLTAFCALFGFVAPALAELPPIPPTPLSARDFNVAAFAEWVDGAENVIVPTGPKDDAHVPQWIVWTREKGPGHSGLAFGDSKNPGVRHLRVGLVSETAVGSIVARAAARVSVLKPGAPYPGDMTDESQWIPAQRLQGAALTAEEAGHDEDAVWVLPPGTKTRALRFTHRSDPTEKTYAGYVGGVFVLKERVANLAPQALAGASANNEAAEKFNNGAEDSWKAWDNGAAGAAQPVSAAHAEWVMLSWPSPVTLSGLATLWTGFSAAEAQIFTGSANEHPREAGDAAWKTIKTFANLPNQYPRALGINFLTFDDAVTTRAVRLRVTQGTKGEGHLAGKVFEGRRIWLGELLALQPLGGAELKTALVPAAPASDLHPPIPVHFKLEKPGFVSLVIEDAAGKRVRNLVSETRFPAGENTAWWDGTDDLGRDADAAKHGLYHIPEQLVAPGDYRVRGLFHAGLDLRYEFGVYNAGRPVWETEDKTGGWLTNHTPPQAVLYVPGDQTPNQKPMVYLGSAVSEGGAGLAWVDLEGRKLGGRTWIGGNWTSAPYLARDEGKNGVPGIFAYVGATWSASDEPKGKETSGELRLTGLTAKDDKVVLKLKFETNSEEKNAEGRHEWISEMSGLAVHDGICVVSMAKLGKLLFVDARAAKVIGETPMLSPRGLAFDAQGRLLFLSGDRLLRATLGADKLVKPSAVEVLVSKGLEDPAGLALDARGSIYVSDRGHSHQVKVFAAGKGGMALVRTIGHAGAPKAGAYDPEHMNNPRGLTVDSQNQLWVAEQDFQPKRASVWTSDGKLLHAFYGPSRYGGGGTLDPQDKTRFYYDGMEFKLDWKSGMNAPVAVFHRPAEDDFQTQFRAGPPETPIYLEGRQYMTNCFNSSPTSGCAIATVWLMKNGVAKPVAALGRASDWGLLASEEFHARWPEGVDLKGDRQKNATLFTWSDFNGDGHVQPSEVTMQKALTGGVTVMPDLALVESRVDDKAMRFAPSRFTDAGVPVYDLAAGKVIAEGAQPPMSSGGDQGLVLPDGTFVLTISARPFPRDSVGGGKNGAMLWQYPSLWPGLHASHEAAVPQQPGELIGTTRLLGGFVTPRNSEAGPLWCVNGNMGCFYLFTADGLFVSQLFQDSRVGQGWGMPKAERNMRLNDVSLHDENFWPSITVSDGQLYLVDGGRSTLVRVDGLETVRRIPAQPLKVTGADLAKAQTWRVQAEAQRQAARGSGSLSVALRQAAPKVDGKLDDWAGAEWATIDRRGTKANFNSSSQPYDITAAVTIAGDRLYAAWRTQDAELLKNSGETPNAPFKTGGCLDLMIGANPAADPKRAKAGEGDERLVVTQVKGKTLALLYRASVPGTREPVPFSSPVRTITLDRVDDLSAEVQFAMGTEKGADGKVSAANYEISVPLAALGLKPAAGQAIKADVGLLRGNGFQTTQRVYWNNKATGITADVPSEAELVPALWGKWEFKAQP